MKTILLVILFSSISQAQLFDDNSETLQPPHNGQTEYCASLGMYIPVGKCPQQARQPQTCTTTWNGYQWISICK